MTKKLKIGKRRYKSVKKRMKIKGLFDPDSKTIAVRRGMNKITEAKTLLHEILHGIIHEYAPEVTTETEEHRYIYPLERGLAEYARHNPTEWLLMCIKLARL